MLKALTRHFQSYEVDLECRHPDGAVEVKKERGDILGFIAQWIKNSEGAIRGCQADAAAARNRAVETRDVLATMVQQSLCHQQSRAIAMQTAINEEDDANP